MWPQWLVSARSDEDDEEPAEVRLQRIRRRNRWLMVGAGLLLFAGVGGVALYRFGGRWLEDRTRVRVQAYLEQQDYRRVQLTLEQAVQVSPHSLPARRALAEFYEAAGSPVATTHWRAVAELAPGDDEVKLKLASSALRLEGAASGRASLAEISAAGQKTLDYQRIAAGIALAEGKADELQQHLMAMAALEPENTRTKIALASVQLRSPEPAVAASARAELERIARGETLRIRATLALLMALPPTNDGNSPGFRELAARILPKGAGGAGSSGAFVLIEHMKGEPQPSAEDAAILVDWMVSSGLAREAQLWLAGQGSAVQNASVVLAARAGAAMQLRDWRLLRQLILDGAWGRLSNDAVELAFAARVQRDRASVANAKETFADAIEAAATSLPTLKALDRLCAIWGWPEESERVLTRIVRDFPRETPAWLGLLAKAEAAEKSARYWDIVRRRAQALPDDAGAQALRTYAAIITGQNDPEARNAALAAFTREDARPEELAAGLLLRWREKSPAVALAALSPRQIETLRRSVKGSLIYGAVLAAAGKDATAALAYAASARLLPEERALLPRSAPAPAPPPPAAH